MSACPNCGAVYRANDKFCNTCGTPIAAAPGGAPSPYGAPPPQPAQYAAPPRGQWGGQPPAGYAPPAQCQLGHEIAPGQNYCAHGHPIALDGVQFAANPGQNYPQGGYPGGGYAQQPQQQAYPGAGGYPGAAQAYGGGGYAQAGQGYAQQPQAPLPGYTPPPPPPPPAGYAQDPRGAYVDPGAAQARVLRGFLVSYQTNPQGDFWPLHSGRLTVGRSNSGEPLDVPLADATISSRHASLTSDAGAGPIVIEDTGSTNGTFVNDEHLGFNGRRELRDGDRVRFGGYTAIVKVIART